MGLYSSGLDPRERIDTSDLAGAMSAWFDAHIQILDPNSADITPYDPVTDTGGENEPSVVWDSGERGALVQPVRAQTVGDFGSQAVGLVAVRIQAAIPAGIDLRSGLQVRVIDGGADTESTRHLYVLGSGIDSSLRWVTRLYCMVTAS